MQLWRCKYVWHRGSLSRAPTQGGCKSWADFALRSIGLVCKRDLRTRMSVRKRATLTSRPFAIFFLKFNTFFCVFWNSSFNFGISSGVFINCWSYIMNSAVTLCESNSPFGAYIYGFSNGMRQRIHSSNLLHPFFCFPLALLSDTVYS